jgi:hypothetical protein
MRTAERTTLCVLLNLIGLVGILSFIFSIADISDIFVYGPSPSLKILTITIDTWAKYLGLIAVSSLIRIVGVLSNELGASVLGFTVYDPTVTVVYGFSKCQLQILTNAMWITNSLTQAFQLFVSIARLDITLATTVAGEITSAITVWYLLSKKSRFVPEFDNEDDEKADLEMVVVMSD